MTEQTPAEPGGGGGARERQGAGGALGASGSEPAGAPEGAGEGGDGRQGAGGPPGQGARTTGALRWIGVAVSAAALGAVAVWAANQQAPTLPSGTGEWLWAATAVGVYGVATLLRGERWLRLMRHAGVELSRADAQALNAVGYMGNNVLPARGGDVLRSWIGAKRSRATVREIVGSLLAERVLDALFLLSLFAFLAYFVLRGIDAPDQGPLAVGLAIGLGVLAAGALALRLGRRHSRGARIAGYLAPLWRATGGLRGRHGAEMTAFTAAVWLAESATYLAGARAVGVELTPVEALYVVAVAGVFILIPSGPGYAGTLDAAIVFGARAVGASGTQAFSYLLMMRFVLLIPITIAGLVLLLRRYGGLGALHDARAGGEAASQ